MVFYFGHEVLPHKLQKLLGDEHKSGIRGSTSYFIKEISSRSNHEVDKLIDSKGLIQLFERGLLLRSFKSAKTYSVALSFEEINKLSLIKGKETIKPIPYSAFWILLKMRMSVDFARYFARFRLEYELEETQLIIEADDFKCKMTTQGYTFNAQKKFFLKMREHVTLDIR